MLNPTVGVTRIIERLRTGQQHLPAAQAAELRRRALVGARRIRHRLYAFAMTLRLASHSAAAPVQRTFTRNVPSRTSAHRIRMGAHRPAIGAHRRSIVDSLHGLPAVFGRALRGLPTIAGHERLLPIGVGVIVVGAAIISTAPVETARGVAPTAVAPRLTISGLAGGIDDRELHYDTTGPMSTEIDDTATGDVGEAIPAEGPIIWKPVVVDTTVPDSRDLLRRYRVQAGDTLTGIARKFDVTMMTVWWANHLKRKDDLHVGQTLVIPPTSGLVVTVREGDTLDEIATRSKVEKDAIFEYNGLEDEVLVAGQVLMIPGALGQAIAVPKPKPQPRTTVSTRSGGTVRRVTSSPPRHYGGGSFAWPVPGGRIAQYYHYGHYGIDIDGDTGDPVRSAAAGTVVFAGWKSNGGGYQVWIAHGSNLYTTYNHMSSVAVHTGSHVARGQRVGRVGCTGNCTGPHLHFEVWNGPVWDGGTRVNPLKYL